MIDPGLERMVDCSRSIENSSKAVVVIGSAAAMSKSVCCIPCAMTSRDLTAAAHREDRYCVAELFVDEPRGVRFLRLIRG